MRPANQKGFTIIEVILFLALSGLFLTIAFAGIRGRTESVQFTDSMRSLQSFLVSEQNKVLNGVNSSPTAPASCSSGSPVDTGTSNNCILVGRVISFGQDVTDLSKVTVSVLYGDKLSPTVIAEENDLRLISETEPRSDGVTESTYQISWGTEFDLSHSINIGSTAEKLNRIGWLRSPGSTRLVPISFEDAVSDLDDKDLYSTSFATTRIGNEVNTKLCFRGYSGRVASILFGDGNGSSGINLVFDDVECKT